MDKEEHNGKRGGRRRESAEIRSFSQTLGRRIARKLSELGKEVKEGRGKGVGSAGPSPSLVVVVVVVVVHSSHSLA